MSKFNKQIFDSCKYVCCTSPPRIIDFPQVRVSTANSIQLLSVYAAITDSCLCNSWYNSAYKSSIKSLLVGMSVWLSRNRSTLIIQANGQYSMTFLFWLVASDILSDRAEGVLHNRVLILPQTDRATFVFVTPYLRFRRSHGSLGLRDSMKPLLETLLWESNVWWHHHHYFWPDFSLKHFVSRDS